MELAKQRITYGTTAQWAASSRVLLSGEIGRNTDLLRDKMGNGTDLWSALTWEPIALDYGRTLPDSNDTLLITDNNKLLVSDRATAYNLTIPDDATGGWANSVEVVTFTVSVQGAGLPTFVASGHALTAPQGATAFATDTIMQAVRRGANDWVIMLSGTAVPGLRLVTGTTDTPTAADMGEHRTTAYNSSSPVTVTLPTNAAVPVGINVPCYLTALGAGKVTVAPPATKTLNAANGLLSIAGQYITVCAIKYDSADLDQWTLLGDRVA